MGGRLGAKSGPPPWRVARMMRRMRLGHHVHGLVGCPATLAHEGARRQVHSLRSKRPCCTRRGAPGGAPGGAPEPRRWKDLWIQPTWAHCRARQRVSTCRRRDDCALRRERGPSWPGVGGCSLLNSVPKYALAQSYLLMAGEGP